jgi:hypothetical protein
MPKCCSWHDMWRRHEPCQYDDVAHMWRVLTTVVSTRYFLVGGVGGNREMKEGGDRNMATSVPAPTPHPVHQETRTLEGRGAFPQAQTLPAEGLFLKIKNVD